ncbi:MAG: CAP domain-containing protein [Bryobacteraceae bacterium]
MTTRVVAGAFVSFAILLAAAENPGISADEILALVNRSRVRSAVPPLRKDLRLTRAAQARADDMAKRAYFAHTSPSGKTPWDFMEEAHYSYERAGENLATGQRNAEEVQRSWLRSPAHRANQLNRRFTETGIGIARVATGVVVVQLFASPSRTD